MQFKLFSELPEKQNYIVVADDLNSLNELNLSEAEKRYVNKEVELKNEKIILNRYDYQLGLYFVKSSSNEWEILEAARKAASDFYSGFNSKKISNLYIVSKTNKQKVYLAFAEGFGLSSYSFLKYFTGDVSKKENNLNVLFLQENVVNSYELKELEILQEAVFTARDLINEPLSYLTASQMAQEFVELSKESGFSIEILNKSKIEALKMGGLLAVNKGSIDPPTFSIMEWKPDNSKNSKPIVLVGKGIVYDTGGLSLKPTSDSMDYMKSDMGGAAAMAATIFAVAKMKLPVHLIALVPATDNRPGQNAYTPGDVIKMFNGKTVEVLNTDAEGRMILADAISYADKYNPELIIDMATLTGSAVMAVGEEASVIMGTADDGVFNRLEKTSFDVFERVVRFPFWEEYGEMIKSDIADVKNVGGREAGAITAGKFLEHFTKHPWIHIDIAGPSYLKKKNSYRGKGGIGTGVRLLYYFIKNYFA